MDKAFGLPLYLRFLWLVGLGLGLLAYSVEIPWSPCVYISFLLSISHWFTFSSCVSIPKYMHNGFYLEISFSCFIVAPSSMLGSFGMPSQVMKSTIWFSKTPARIACVCCMHGFCSNPDRFRIERTFDCFHCFDLDFAYVGLELTAPL